MIGVEHVGFVIYHTITYWSGKVDWFLRVPVKLNLFL